MSFQQALSGLNAASRNLDVIGHNIANSGTTGMKASRAEFAEIYASSVGAMGGTSVGLGVQANTVSQQFTQGGLTVTGNSLDVAINGGGFFQLRNGDGSTTYTRAGNLKLDKDGNIVTNGGAQVMGYSFDAKGVRQGIDPTPLKLPVGTPVPAKQTETIQVSLNLDARAPDAAGNPAATPPVPATPRSTFGTSINVYDSQGVATPVNLYFQKSGTANTWDVYDRLDDPNATPPVVATPVGQITFGNDGKITGPAATAPATGFGMPVTIQPPTPNPNNLPALTVNVDLSDVTQFGAKFAVSDLSQDGYTAGQLTGIKIENDGIISASYSNGLTQAAGQISLVNFRNLQGLAPTGSGEWIETAASGQPVRGAPGEGTLGQLRSGALEESNVDLTAELVNMMTTQRAYQANAQTIKTQDQIMSTLVNLR